MKYLIHSLYPFLEQFDQEQIKEKNLEAKIQGTIACISSSSQEQFLFVSVYLLCCFANVVVFGTGLSPSEIEVEQAECCNDERVYW